MFAASDDIAMIKQILATRVPDGRLVNVKPILKIIESIFYRAKSVAVLKQLPDILEDSSWLKVLFDAVVNLIVAVVEVTKCIDLFSELPSQYILTEAPPLSIAMTHIPTAVYWTIRSIVTCASQIAGLIGLSQEHIAMTIEAWELSGLTYKVISIHDHLKKQLATCHQHIAEKKQIEAYQVLVHMFEKYRIDNGAVVKHLLNPRDDPLPLWEGMTQKRVSTEVTRSKTALLLISDLDISLEDVELLANSTGSLGQDRTTDMK